jgi:hypothetical protein
LFSSIQIPSFCLIIGVYSGHEITFCGM